MSASGRFGREITVEEVQYREEEGVVRPIWTVSGDGTYDEKIETIHEGNVVNTVYGNGGAKIYPFDPIDIPIEDVSHGDSYTIRATPGVGLSEDFFEPRTAIDEGEILEVSGTFSLPDVMRTDFDFSSTAQLTYTYSVPGEFINRTDWNIEATNVSYNFDTEEATIELKGWYDNPEGYVEGRFMWRTGVNGTMVHEIEESAGGKPKLMNWGNFDGTEDRSELIVPAEPGDVITIALYRYNDYDDEEQEETGLNGSFEIDGDPTDMLVLLVPQDTREADVELIDCAYNADTVVAGSTARMFVTLENTQKMDTLADLTFGSGRNAGTVEGIELAPYEVRNVEVEITPEVTGEYDFTPSIDAYRPDDPRR